MYKLLCPLLLLMCLSAIAVWAGTSKQKGGRAGLLG